MPNWVNGTQAEPCACHPIEVINPADELPFATIDATPRGIVDEIVAKSQENFREGTWSKADASERFTVLVKAASILRERISEFVTLEVRQTGRPVREMRAQLARIPEWLEYFAGLARVQEGMLLVISLRSMRDSRSWLYLFISTNKRFLKVRSPLLRALLLTRSFDNPSESLV